LSDACYARVTDQSKAEGKAEGQAEGRAQVLRKVRLTTAAEY